ncbi:MULTISPECIES: LysM peptidoglycan-binding and 3D domain-containing protein [Bacillus]|uniref:LysM peptidoglycan-binding domain-containing protein n=1 Tax=Bacillus vallismortis TaxID=72361 RepID=A0AAP3FW55_BACVA|nr:MULTISPECIES: 3D domain-containing protein [Bacillus]MBG9767893.1 peptidoglycan-binding protein [Bacillus vallismortis]MCI3986648.1 LysM peptidoglycan-binding domain-containing protein [Bacillus vallismortis]MCI4138696.1 LysM peptidoglycan-binding domain-containing protein [Bacillus vallismortis]MCY7892714.1 LysM peptidoglycan-binding domain-containing protein [Bacillus vallismortis]MCY8318307.1 LysM peptidoglycan-binding domain-containing protein [Bacillus vallismortis]
MKKTIMSFVAVAALSSTAFGAHASAKEITVQKGDTLWGISQKNGVNLKDLKEWNKLTSDKIIAGEKLTISSEETTTTGQYTIKAGDTLTKIAQQFGTTVNNLKVWNNLSSDMIYAGSTLSVKGQATAATAVTENTQTSAPQTEAKQEAVQKEQPKQQPKQETKAAAETSVPTEEKAVQSNTNHQEASKELTVTATAYTANDGGISGVTATGIDLNKNPNAKVIAVDPNVIPLGSKVYVEGYGEATAGDTGGAIKGNKIDVFVPNKSDASNWGVKTVNVKILN